MGCGFDGKFSLLEWKSKIYLYARANIAYDHHHGLRIRWKVLPARVEIQNLSVCASKYCLRPPPWVADSMESSPCSSGNPKSICMREQILLTTTTMGCGFDGKFSLLEWKSKIYLYARANI